MCLFIISDVRLNLVLQENLCAHRGLVANTDAQTFRMALPLALRVKYDEVFRVLNDRVCFMIRGFQFDTPPVFLALNRQLVPAKMFFLGTT